MAGSACEGARRCVRSKLKVKTLCGAIARVHAPHAGRGARRWGGGRGADGARGRRRVGRVLPAAAAARGAANREPRSRARARERCKTQQRGRAASEGSARRGSTQRRSPCRRRRTRGRKHIHSRRLPQCWPRSHEASRASARCTSRCTAVMAQARCRTCARVRPSKHARSAAQRGGDGRRARRCGARRRTLRASRLRRWVRRSTSDSARSSRRRALPSPERWRRGYTGLHLCPRHLPQPRASARGRHPSRAPTSGAASARGERA